MYKTLLHLNDVLFGLELVRKLLALVHCGEAQDAVHAVVVLVGGDTVLVHAAVHELLHAHHLDHHADVLAAVALHHHEVSLDNLQARAVREALGSALELDLQG